MPTRRPEVEFWAPKWSKREGGACASKEAVRQALGPSTGVNHILPDQMRLFDASVALLGPESHPDRDSRDFHDYHQDSRSDHPDVVSKRLEFYPSCAATDIQSWYICRRRDRGCS